MVFLKALEKLFWAYPRPLGEGALQVMWGRIQMPGQQGEFGFHRCGFSCKVVGMLFQYLNCFRNKFVLLLGFKLCHGDVLNV